MADASRLGVPAGVLKGWFGALNLMQRRFQIRESIGPPIRSSTGFAEGCALSCAAMTIMDILLDKVVQSHVAGAVPLSFVDGRSVKPSV